MRVTQPSLHRVPFQLALIGCTALVVACQNQGRGADRAANGDQAGGSVKGKPKYVIAETDTAGRSLAIFAGGCFWCVESDFEDRNGVGSVISGYIGGEEVDPSYDAVSYGKTGHTEAVLVTFDPTVVSYDELLRFFWVTHDPTTNDRQFCDRGRQYRPGIFYLNDEQKRLAEASLDWARENGRFDEPIRTEITRATEFWPAEEYHQDFYEKNPLRYKTYRIGCRRDARLSELWGRAAELDH